MWDEREWGAHFYVTDCRVSSLFRGKEDFVGFEWGLLLYIGKGSVRGG